MYKSYSNSRRAILFCLLCFALSFPASAAQAITARTTQSVVLKSAVDLPLSVRLSAGLANGKSHELVYEETTKYSELIWHLENVPMVGLSASLGLPLDAALNFALWGKIDEPSAHMVDFDWLDSNHPHEWSHFSYSPTHLTRGEMYDANLVVPVIRHGNGALSGVLGFRHDHWRWEDHGGYFIYSSGGFRNKTMTFEDETGITYEQWFYAPYLGLQLDLAVGDFLFSGRLVGSKWAWAEDNDHHIYRDMVFKDSFRGIDYLSYGAEVAYPLTEALTVSVSVDAQKYYRTLGDVEVSTPTAKGHFDDGAGIEHYLWMTAVSLEYRF